MGNPLKYYTYIHSSPEGDVFYVGKGSGQRVYSTADRGYLWHERRMGCNGITMRIVQRFKAQEEALEHEKELIAYYKSIGADLVNLTDGGIGPNGYRFSPESNRRRSEKLLGYKHQILECPYCKTKGGATTLKRWHFENCQGVRPTYKARTTIFSIRHYLGKFQTKAIALSHEQEFKDLAIEEYSHLKILRSRTLKIEEQSCQEI